MGCTYFPRCPGASDDADGADDAEKSDCVVLLSTDQVRACLYRRSSSSRHCSSSAEIEKNEVQLGRWDLRARIETRSRYPSPAPRGIPRVTKSTATILSRVFQL